jgi:putative acetyltransferase
MLELSRTTAADPDFRALTAQLDEGLRAQYGAEQATYDTFNQLGSDTPAVVARAGGAPIGCACFRPESYLGAAELKRMFVAPAHRRAGVAGALLREIEAWARERRIAAIVLETGNKQIEAIALYARHGYAEIPLFGPYVGMALSVCMRKEIGG